MLLVTGVERTVVRIPFRERVRPWNEILVGQWGVVEILRVRTNSADIVGYGETMLHYTWKTVSDEAIAKVVGTNPADHLFDDSLGAGLQMALLDIVGKSLDIPAYRLLGGMKVRDWAPISWWTTKAPPEVLAAEAKDAVAEGYLSHKFKARPWFDVYEQVEAISAVTPPHYKIDMDWNEMLLAPGNAIEVLRKLDSYERVGLYEAPISTRIAADVAEVRRRVTHPIVDHYSDVRFAEQIAADAVDGFVVASAGISGLIKQALTSTAHNKQFFLQVVGPGLTTAFCLHFAAIFSHARWPAITCMNTFNETLISSPIEIKGGYARVPEAPGLGVTLDEDAVERLRMEPPYTVEYPRTILSFSLGNDRVRHYARVKQLWDECRFIGGIMPVQEPGARLTIRDDDGSADFSDLYARASKSPVWTA